MASSDPRDENWAEIQKRLLEGDRLAFLKIQRLVTGCLVNLRAYDFQQEWDDLRQEVLESIVANARAERLRDPKAFVGYVRIITRNKFFDRLKRRERQREKEMLPWDEETARAAAERADRRGDPADEVWQLVEGLPPEERLVIEEVYRQGKTYDEVCAQTGLPLGTMKRRLRQALESLRVRAAAAFEG